MKDLWDVFLLFAIPVGGGIPAGVLLAQSRGVDYASMTALYLASDVCLAIVFEPLMLLFLMASRHSPLIARMRAALRKSTELTVAGYGAKPGPFFLVIIAFGVDPMTGRAAAMAAGHSFVSGWAIAIAGDMLFFGVIAVSTICLNNVLGDGTWTAVIIMFLMIVVPGLFRRLKKVFSARTEHDTQAR